MRYLTDNLDSLTLQLKDWNRFVFGNIFQRKRRVLTRLNGIQKSLRKSRNRFLGRLENKLLAEYYQITRKEEIHWFQKSRCKWIIYGDKNSSYFHTKTVIRRQRNKIRMLKNDSNVWVEDEDFLRDMARLFYQNLFKREDSLV